MRKLLGAVAIAAALFVSGCAMTVPLEPGMDRSEVESALGRTLAFVSRSGSVELYRCGLRSGAHLKSKTLAINALLNYHHAQKAGE